MVARDRDLQHPVAYERLQFTEKQIAFFDYVQMGMDFTPAARKAGFKDPKRWVRWAKTQPAIMDEIERRWEENREKMRLTRDKVQEMVMRAYEVGELTSDPGAMVRACAELNKMSGFYEVESSKIALNKAQKELVSRLNELSDEELLAMSSAARAIDVDAEQEADAAALLEYTDAEYEVEEDSVFDAGPGEDDDDE